jgi:hypothetical protein
LRREIKIGTIANKVGLVNCLWQPGQLRNRSQILCEKLLKRLLNFVHCERSCYRDKVNRAASQPTAALFFAHLLDYFIMTQNFTTIYRERYRLANYHDHRLIVHLPGLAKNKSALTLTATNQTARPLAFMVCLADNDRKTEVDAVIKMEVGPPQVLYRRNLQTALRCFSEKCWEVLNG